jgi:hypothetical protein
MYNLNFNILLVGDLGVDERTWRRTFTSFKINFNDKSGLNGFTGDFPLVPMNCSIIVEVLNPSMIILIAC